MMSLVSTLRRLSIADLAHLLAPILGCVLLAGAAQAAETLVVDGVERRYELFVPQRAEAAPALVVALHPRPASGAAMRFISGFDKVAEAHGFLVAYPDGLGRTWNGLTCCGRADDVGFIVALVEQLKATRNVDPKRVYVVGVSNGGEMAFRLVGEAPTLFAAIGVVASGRAGLRRDNGTPVESALPPQPLPLISLVGARDERAADFERGLQSWRSAYDCKTVGQPAPYPATDLSLSTCRGGARLVSYVFNDVGHVWPGAKDSGPLSWPDAPVSAAGLLWEFFASRQRP